GRVVVPAELAIVFTDEFAAGRHERLLERAELVFSRLIVWRRDEDLLGDVLGHPAAHRLVRLPVREPRAEDPPRAALAADGVGAGVGHDQDRLAVVHLVAHAHEDSAVHGRGEDVDVVRIDELLRLADPDGWLHLVVFPDHLDLAAGHGPVLTREHQLHALRDRFAQHGVDTGVRQHEADLDRRALGLAALYPRPDRDSGRGRRGAGEKGSTGQSAHVNSSLGWLNLHRLLL